MTWIDWIIAVILRIKWGCRHERITTEHKSRNEKSHLRARSTGTDWWSSSSSVSLAALKKKIPQPLECNETQQKTHHQISPSTPSIKAHQQHTTCSNFSTKFLKSKLQMPAAGRRRIFVGPRSAWYWASPRAARELCTCVILFLRLLLNSVHPLSSLR